MPSIILWTLFIVFVLANFVAFACFELAGEASVKRERGKPPASYYRKIGLVLFIIVNAAAMQLLFTLWMRAHSCG